MINGMLWTGDYKATGMDHPIVNELFKSGILLRTWTTVENWIWTPRSSLVNEARFGYNRAGQTFGVLDGGIVPDGSGGLCTATGCGGKGYPINTGEKSGTGLPNIDISGFGGSGGLLGSWRGRPGSNAPNPYYDIQDSVSYLRGRHALKFGGEFAHIEADATPNYFRGRIQFRGKGTPGLTDCGGNSCPLQNFFAGNPNRALLNVRNGHR